MQATCCAQPLAKFLLHYLVSQDRTFRKRLNAEGEVEGVRSSRLSDFVASSLQAQQALRRSLRPGVRA